jgi:hypothetical protein
MLGDAICCHFMRHVGVEGFMVKNKMTNGPSGCIFRAIETGHTVFRTWPVVGYRSLTALGMTVFLVTRLENDLLFVATPSF